MASEQLALVLSSKRPIHVTSENDIRGTQQPPSKRIRQEEQAALGSLSRDSAQIDLFSGRRCMCCNPEASSLFDDIDWSPPTSPNEHSMTGASNSVGNEVRIQPRSASTSETANGEEADAPRAESTPSLTELYQSWRNPCLPTPITDHPVLNVQTHSDYTPSQRSSQHTNVQCVQRTITKDMLKRMRVISQLDRKFILAVVDNLLYIIDQHAADERIRLERLQDKVFGDVASEITVDEQENQHNTPNQYEDLRNHKCVFDSELQLIRTYRRQLERWGWTFVFGKEVQDRPTRSSYQDSVMENGLASDTVLLKTAPVIEGVRLTVEDLCTFVHDLVCTRGSFLTRPQAITRILNTKACRGAIKFGDKLNHAQCVVLLEHLAQCDLPFQCAHGRPSMIPLLDLADLDQSSSAMRDKEATESGSGFTELLDKMKNTS